MVGVADHGSGGTNIRLAVVGIKMLGFLFGGIRWVDLDYTTARWLQVLYILPSYCIIQGGYNDFGMNWKFLGGAYKCFSFKLIYNSGFGYWRFHNWVKSRGLQRGG